MKDCPQVIIQKQQEEIEYLKEYIQTLKDRIEDMGIAYAQLEKSKGRTFWEKFTGTAQVKMEK